MPNDSIVFVGLMPHAPILVSGVGREHHTHVRRTLAAMQQIATHTLAVQPDTVLIISPHSPRRAGAFGIWQTPLLHGSFEEFGSDESRVDLPLDREFTEQLEKQTAARGLHTWRILSGKLDHGATVPLSFLVAAGWQGPTAIVSLNEPADEGLDEFGHAIAAAAGTLGRRLAIIASGDMSHRLNPSAPCGFHADGRRFDETFIDLLHNGSLQEVRHLNPVLLENAAQDVVESTRIALASTDYVTPGRTVLSYEGPFGVGYGVAILAEQPVATSTAPAAAVGPLVLSHWADLPGVARAAVAAHFAGGPEEPPFVAAGELTQPHGVFVTLRGKHEVLRGCRGSPTPEQPDLIHETWRCAREAALLDSRFPPLREEQLSQVRFSVSILGPLEPVASPSLLDPALYGVLVTSKKGRRGLLLPAIKGVDTVAEQLRLVRHKAGIQPEEKIEIQRFTTQVFQEPPLPPDDE